jgi:small multidrug resistance family-3 protein
MILDLLRTFLLFVGSAIAELIGCYLPYLWLREGRSPWQQRPTAWDVTGVLVTLLGMVIIVAGSFRTGS